MMQEFTLWFVHELPDFLLAEPVIYFVSCLVLFWIFKIFISLIDLGR